MMVMLSAARNRQSVAPATACVSVDQVKANLRYLDSAFTDDDPTILECIYDATDWVQNETRRALITQTRVQTEDRFQGTFFLRFGPAISVTSITYLDTAAASQTAAASLYRLDTRSIPARVTLALNKTWPTEADLVDSITITYTAGFGTTPQSVPRMYRRAIIAYASWLYDPSIACSLTPEQYLDKIRGALSNEGSTIQYA